MAKAIKELLINKLASGEFISGQTLGDEIGVSRTAISKQIKSLTEMGLDIFSVTGKGYKLVSPIELLDKEFIVKELAAKKIHCMVETHNIIDSTNDYLMRRIPNHVQNAQVCIAEYQSAGRGRRGRQWISPFGSHIYMSMYWSISQGMTAAMGLNTIVALAISDAINSLYQINVQLKWPNDIYLDGLKLAGILIDLEGTPNESCHAVIGIGLNLNMPDKSGGQVDQPWTDLQQHTSININRNELAATIIQYLTYRLEQHKVSGLEKMVNEWNKLDYFYDQPVTLITGNNQTHGICKGINDQGALLLLIDSNIKVIYGGEVSLRGAK
ncbi:bifunctional biotin--[acetyl-CoA-carboxylase] ligase/biotin operon repressor BirA [Colwellia sp. UCD-KL20]|uniref:bifunctional biotin--[acetyl-CoA-carboxylase] ligase/biotin operon repressor BirA n=1 Tax=Colwellia sp. UCD-KL20 TaxID=1917165 RepID=UPI0009705B2A|nr:bifunctional biotin--[acetyl-CoA-carboxylase] ligase/biotin operon repressor BirA [Colwellia sp. UCD-KL20]